MEPDIANGVKKDEASSLVHKALDMGNFAMASSWLSLAKACRHLED